MLKNQLFLWTWNLYDYPLAGLHWERQFQKVLLQTVWEKAPTWQCLFIYRQQGVFLPVYGLFSFYVDDIRMAEIKQNVESMLKQIDLEIPTTFLDQENAGCT